MKNVRNVEWRRSVVCWVLCAVCGAMEALFLLTHLQTVGGRRMINAPLTEEEKALLITDSPA